MNTKEETNEQINFTWKAKTGKEKSFKITATIDNEFTIDWGDNSPIETIIGKEDFQEISYKYKTDGIYNVVVKGSTTDCNFRHLYCSSQKLTVLDITNCKELEELWCHDNQLKTIDINNNKNLKKIYLTANELHSLDVSNNSALEILNCSFNNLKILDVSKNAELWKFDCSYNRLSNLDISSNKKLQYFDCTNNQINDLETENTVLELKSKDVHIGQEIFKKFLEYKKNNKEFHKYKFAEKLCCDNKTVYNIFQNRSIHTATLISISKILDFDFIEFLKDVYKK